MVNPFRPSFGVTPPLLAGRDTEILAFGDALDSGPGAPGRATLYTGVRGIGKTVMLNEAETQARQRGWVTVSETAIPGMIDRLTTHRLPEAAATLELSSSGRKVTAVAFPFHLGGLTWQTPAAEHRPDLRAQLTALTDHLATHGTGLLLTVDELHRAGRAGLRELAATIQHCFREERPIAFAGAGLPTAVADLLNDDVLTFLRRADRYHLGAVDPADVADALRTPLNATGHGITETALDVAAAGTGGYPFLIQLVGFWMCKLADTNTASNDASVIDDAAAAAGVQAARRRLGSLIHKPALQDLSHIDRTFLAAMAVDEGPSRMADIAARLNADANYASQYRLRLIAADMIHSAGHGHVEYTLPYLRDYLREHAASAGL
jgi:AAA ATPase domain